MYNDGRDIATLQSSYGDATSWWSIDGLNIDLARYNRLQVRVRKGPDCLHRVYFWWGLTGPGIGANRPQWYDSWTESGEQWKTYIFDFTGASFVATAATIGLRTDDPYPPGAMEIDFMLLSSVADVVYEEEPPGYTPPLAPQKTSLQALDPYDFKNQYRALYEEALARLQKAPRPGGRLYDAGGFFHIDRGVSVMRFSKSSGVCTEVVIRGYRMKKGCALGNLVLLDQKGRRFEQRLSRGSFKAWGDDGHFWMEGSFAPRDRGGNEFPARFKVSIKVFRSSGLVILRYALVEGSTSLPVTKLSLENTLGKTPRPLEYLHHCNHWPGGLETFIEASTDSDRIRRHRDEFENIGWGVHRPLFVDLSGDRTSVVDQEQTVLRSYIVSHPSRPKFFSFMTSDQCREVPQIDIPLVTDIATEGGGPVSVSRDMYRFETLPEGQGTSKAADRYISLKVYKDPNLADLVGESRRVTAREVKSGCWRSFHFNPPLSLQPDTIYFADPSMGDNDPKGMISYYVCSEDRFPEGRLFDPDNPDSAHWDASFRIYRTAKVPAVDRRVVISDRGEFATWSDGYGGFQVFPLDWASARIDSGVAVDPFGDRFLSCQVGQSGERYANVTAIHVPEGVELPRDFATGQAFALMPFKKFRPLPEVASASNWVSETMYPHAGEKTFGGVDKAEIGIAEMSRAGVGLLITALSSRPRADKFYTDLVELHHRYGLLSLYYQDQFAGVPGYDLDGQPLSEEERNAGFCGFHAWAPEVSPGTLNLSAKEYPGVRQYWLAQVNNIMRTFPQLDGFYFDDAVLLGCDNPRHGYGDTIHYPVEENMIHYENIRRLVDSFGPGKRILTHQWARVSCPVDALSDYTLPGEHIGGLRRTALSPVEENITYSSLLSGCQVVLYGVHSYQFIDPNTGQQNLTVIEQALRKACAPWMNYYAFAETNDESNNRQGKDISFTPAEIDLFRKFMFPLPLFGTGNSELHHPMDVDYSRYVAVKGKDVDALVYSRPGECLVVAVNVPHNESRAEVRLSARALRLRGHSVLVFDTRDYTCHYAPVVDAWVLMGRLNLARGPRILLVREIPKYPAVLWGNIATRRLEQRKVSAQGEVMLNLHGVPGAKGEVFLYCAGGVPDRALGAELASFDPASGLAQWSFAYPPAGKIELRIPIRK